jgi:hypothetical protein
MSTKKKIIAWTVVTLLAMPAFATLNLDVNHFFINVLGFAYAVGMFRLAPVILPQWMVDYFSGMADNFE